MNTYLTTRLVGSRHGMYECIVPRAAVLQITLDAPDTRNDLLVQVTYLWMQDNEGQVVSKVICVIMSRR